MIPIPIKSGPINLRIRGTEGMTTRDVLDQIDRGARLVMYRYAMSFISISFLRSSDVFCVPAGRSRIAPGLRYSLLSLVVGWWALSGIVFTIKALVQNFRGGIDVTDQVKAVFSSAAGNSVPRLILEDSTFSLAPSPESMALDPVRTAAAAESRRRNKNFLLIVGGVIATLVLALMAYSMTHYPLALVNGSEKPYSVDFDGKTVHLPPNRAQILAITVGKHIARATLPDGSEHLCEFEVGADWYDPSTPRLCTIVNPDRRALIAEQHRLYDNTTSTASIPEPRIWAVHDVLTVKRPYFFFEDFPLSVEVAEGSKDNFRNQITMLPHHTTDENIRLLIKYGTREELRDYRNLLTNSDPSEPLLKLQ